MINEALRIRDDDSSIKRKLKQAIKQANIAMIKDEDIEEIAKSVINRLNSRSGSGPSKGDAMKSQDTQPEEENEDKPFLKDPSKTNARSDTQEKLENYISQLQVGYEVMKTQRNKERWKTELEKINKYDQEVTNLFLDYNFKDHEKHYNEYKKITRAIRNLVKPKKSVKESLNVDVDDEELKTIIQDAIKNADVSDFLRLSDTEVDRIYNKVLPALKKMDIDYSRPEVEDNSAEREQQAGNQKTESLDKDSDNPDYFEKEDAGDVEKNIEAFNSSFGEDLKTIDALFVLNRLNESEQYSDDLKLDNYMHTYYYNGGKLEGRPIEEIKEMRDIATRLINRARRTDNQKDINEYSRYRDILNQAIKSSDSDYQIKQQIERDIWSTIHGSDVDFDALKELAHKYKDYKSAFYSIKNRILKKERWYS